jgi:hypothetical protein
MMPRKTGFIAFLVLVGGLTARAEYDSRMEIELGPATGSPFSKRISWVMTPPKESIVWASGPEGYDFQTQTRPERLRRMLEKVQLPFSARKLLSGSAELVKQIRSSLEAPLLNDSYDWASLSVDCKKDIRSLLYGSPPPQHMLDFWYAPCGKDNLAARTRFTLSNGLTTDMEGSTPLREAFHRLNVRIAEVKQQIKLREQFVRILNLAAVEMASQRESLHRIAEYESHLGSCETPDLTTFTKCLGLDAEKRQTALRFIANDQAIIDGLYSIPAARHLDSYKNLKMILETEIAKLVTLLESENPGEVRGMIE